MKNQASAVPIGSLPLYENRSTKSEINRTVQSVCEAIQKLCKEGTPQSLTLAASLIHPAATLVNESKPYLD